MIVAAIEASKTKLLQSYTHVGFRVKYHFKMKEVEKFILFQRQYILPVVSYLKMTRHIFISSRVDYWRACIFLTILPMYNAGLRNSLRCWRYNDSRAQKEKALALTGWKLFRRQ